MLGKAASAASARSGNGSRASTHACLAVVAGVDGGSRRRGRRCGLTAASGAWGLATRCSSARRSSSSSIAPWSVPLSRTARGTKPRRNPSLEKPQSETRDGRETRDGAFFGAFFPKHCFLLIKHTARPTKQPFSSRLLFAANPPAPRSCPSLLSRAHATDQARDSNRRSRPPQNTPPAENASRVHSACVGGTKSSSSLSPSCSSLPW